MIEYKVIFEGYDVEGNKRKEEFIEYAKHPYFAVMCAAAKTSVIHYNVLVKYRSNKKFKVLKEW